MDSVGKTGLSQGHTQSFVPGLENESDLSAAHPGLEIKDYSFHLLRDVSLQSGSVVASSPPFMAVTVDFLEGFC